MEELTVEKENNNSGLRHVIMGITALPLAFLILIPIASLLTFVFIDINSLVEDALNNNTVSQADIEAQIFENQVFLTATMIAQFLVFLVTAFIGYMVVSWGRIRSGGFKQLLDKFGLPTQFNKQFGKHVLLGVIVGIAAMILLQTLGFLFSVMGQEVGSSDTSVMMGESGNYILLLFVVPLLGPIVEEIFFRGYIQGFITNKGIKKGTSSIVAIIVSSLLFSIVHFQGFSTFSDFFVLGWTFILGLSFALTYRYTGKITSAIIGHIVYNGITVAFILIPLLFS